MPTRSLYIDGASGTVAIINYAAWSVIPTGTTAGSSTAITNPTTTPENVYFHTALQYITPDPASSSAVPVSLTDTPVAYYTWSDGGCGCFITTAVVEYMGGKDDGWELETLRFFRDKYMGATEDGRAKLRWYYENAPRIVEALRQRSDAKQLFERMYTDFIVPSALMVIDGDLGGAEKMYTKGVMYATEMAGEKWDKL